MNITATNASSEASPAGSRGTSAHRSRRRRLVVTAALAGLVAPVAATASTGSASAAPYCGIVWGSLAKTSMPLATGRVLAVRSGQHTCFDRVVFDISRGTGKVGYNVRYVSQVTGPGSGLPVTLDGGARIQITVHAPATTRVPTTGVVNYAGWRTFRQLRWLGSFEGYTDFGLGVRARLPMRVFTLTNADGGQRLVVDVAHLW
jgi:hypothetical protein